MKDQKLVRKIVKSKSMSILAKARNRHMVKKT